MKTILGIILGIFLTFSATASELIRGTTLADGQQLFASDLHSLVDTATVGVQFYNDQQTTPSLSSGYYFLILDAGNQVYRRVTAQTVLYGNTNMWINQVAASTVQSNATVLFYDPTNNYLRSITVSNLFQSCAPFLGVQHMLFAATNSLSTNTFQQLLPSYPNASVDYGPTNSLQLLVWDTNGVSKTMTVSNFINSFYAPFYTNNGASWWWTNAFQPWLIYPTNSTTNAWGYSTNFAITNLFFTNSVVPTNSPYSNNIPTLVDTDKVPVSVASQLGTNTTASLLALYQYTTNKLPNYSPARLQFNGSVPTTVHITNASVASKTFQTDAITFPSNTITPVSFYISGVIGTTIPSNPQVTTNTPYYAVGMGTNALWVQLFTNYTDALLTNNPVLPTGAATGATANQVLYLTNYAHFNADAFYLVKSGGVRTSTYDVYYETNLGTSSYYVNASAMQASDSTVFSCALSSDNIQAAGRVRIQTVQNSNGGGTVAVESPRVELVIQNP